MIRKRELLSCTSAYHVEMNERDVKYRKWAVHDYFILHNLLRGLQTAWFTPAPGPLSQSVDSSVAIIFMTSFFVPQRGAPIVYPMIGVV